MSLTNYLCNLIGLAKFSGPSLSFHLNSFLSLLSWLLYRLVLIFSLFALSGPASRPFRKANKINRGQVCTITGKTFVLRSKVTPFSI